MQSVYQRRFYPINVQYTKVRHSFACGFSLLHWEWSNQHVDYVNYVNAWTFFWNVWRSWATIVILLIAQNLKSLHQRKQISFLLFDLWSKCTVENVIKSDYYLFLSFSSENTFVFFHFRVWIPFLINWRTLLEIFFDSINTFCWMWFQCISCLTVSSFK